MRRFSQTSWSIMAVLFLLMGASSLVHAGKFTAISSKLTTARAGHTATLLKNGQVLLAGGFRTGTFPSPALSTAEIYDPAKKTFTKLTAKMRSARTSHAASLLADGRVLLTGGQTDNNNGDGTNTAEIFDPVTQSFTSVQSKMTSYRGGHASESLPDGTVVIMGGYYNDSSQATAELFNPKTLRFTALTSRMKMGRSEFGATALTNGRVLITGGNSSRSTDNTAEFFDPRTRSFSALSSRMTTARGGHGASRLADGSVLVSGGAKGLWPLVVLKSAEIFNPKTLKFNSTSATMTTARFWPTQTTLNDGSILLTGGLNVKIDGSMLILNTAEKYIP